jgi:hypothetical protein
VDELDRIDRLRRLPPAIPDSALDELAREIHRPVDRAACEREITAAVRLRCAGDLSSFDRLCAPLKAIAHVRFENAVELGLATAAMFSATSGLPLTSAPRWRTIERRRA